MSESDNPDGDADPDPIFNDEAREEIRSIVNESIDPDELDLDIDPPEPDLPDGLVTEDDLESFREEVSGMDQDELESLIPDYSLGAVKHLLLEDCEHEQHQELREEIFDRLGIEREEADADDGGDGGDGAEGESDADDGEDEEDEPEAWEYGSTYDTVDESPWGKS